MLNLKAGDRIRRTRTKGPDPTDPMLDFHLGEVYVVRKVNDGNVEVDLSWHHYGIPNKYLVPKLFELLLQ